MTLVKVDKGDYVVTEGERGTDLFFVLTGTVHCEYETDDGLPASRSKKRSPDRTRRPSMGIRQETGPSTVAHTVPKRRFAPLRQRRVSDSVRLFAATLSTGRHRKDHRARHAQSKRAGNHPSGCPRHRTESESIKGWKTTIKGITIKR